MPDNLTVTEGVVSSSQIPLDILQQLEEQEVNAAIAEGKSPKDVEWDMFINCQFVQFDTETAKKHLNKYIGLRLNEENDIEHICFELFQDFSQGRRGAKKSVECAEYVLSRIQNTRNIDLLDKITAYFEETHNEARIAPFYYTLYEIYSRGEGVAPDIDKAIHNLKSAIIGVNTPEFRKQLRRLYEQKQPDLSNFKRECYAYEQVINDNIPAAKSDYAEYLLQQNKNSEAVHWFVADENFSSAYQAVNIKKKADIDAAAKEFKSADEADKKFTKALTLMQGKYDTLQDIFVGDKTPTYGGLFIRYFLLNYIYALGHTFNLSKIAFVVALILAVASFIGGMQTGHAEAALIAFVTVWTIGVVGIDFWRRHKFVAACRLWEKLPPHPQLEKQADIFADSEKIVNSKQRGWLVVPTIAVVLLCGAVGMVAAEMPPEYMESASKNDTATATATADETPVTLDYTSMQKTELSLGGLDIGDSVSMMRERLGKETSQKQKDGLYVFSYPHVEVTTQNGQIVSIVSLTDEAKTKRKIHQSSTLGEVIDAYGTNYKKSTHNNLTLYEYDFSSPESQGILRFAVDDKNNKIDYISARKSEDKTASSTADVTAQNDTEKTFREYYKAIDNRKYKEAYGHLTNKCQNKLGSLEKFAKGHNDTLTVEVTEFKQLDATPKIARIAYKIKARDRNGNGVKVQIFGGEAVLTNDNNRWYIDEIKSKLIESHNE